MKTRSWRKITLYKLWDYLVLTNIKYALWYFAAYFPLFQDLMSWKIRPALWRLLGAKVGKNVFIGYGVYLDVGGVKRVMIGNNVLIAAQCLLLTHKRDLRKYDGRGLQNELGFKEETIELKDNSSIGMRTMVLPGVIIGENTVVGAGSVVSKNIPDNVIAVGNPLAIVKEFKAL